MGIVFWTLYLTVMSKALKRIEKIVAIVHAFGVTVACDDKCAPFAQCVDESSEFNLGAVVPPVIIGLLP